MQQQQQQYVGRQIRALLHAQSFSRFQPMDMPGSFQPLFLVAMSISNCLRKRWAGGGKGKRVLSHACTLLHVEYETSIVFLLNHACLLVLQATADQRTWDEGRKGRV